MAHTVVFKDSSVILPSQEQLEGCPIHQVPLAVHVPMNPEKIVSRLLVAEILDRRPLRNAVLDEDKPLGSQLSQSH